MSDPELNALQRKIRIKKSFLLSTFKMGELEADRWRIQDCYTLESEYLSAGNHISLDLQVLHLDAPVQT